MWIRMLMASIYITLPKKARFWPLLRPFQLARAYVAAEREVAQRGIDTSTIIAAITRAWTTSPQLTSTFGRTARIIERQRDVKRRTIEQRRRQHINAAA
ncbi:hypothetical protein W911_04975 [Hyphomicrobium nitrativorans NL23]|uniref:Uncharacterized protein n=1 Tax=Hyphomicrobium nitrativorans NL23 TaxID=1029756 RepID=V5SIS7_9HYPH|nr:hypothetical protein W911_04975 [Hyphomicrobium nitrativorans NL23]